MKFVSKSAVATATFVPILTAAAIVLSPYAASASQLIYTPINPNFGGSPFNGPFLFDQANAQDQYSALPKPSSQQKSPSAAQSFAQRLENALVSQAAALLSNQILGPNALPSGTFSTNGTTISWQTVNGEVTVTIVDASTGGTTTITIPAP
jgi:curli production assembly/transport component CsgF